MVCHNNWQTSFQRYFPLLVLVVVGGYFRNIRISSTRRAVRALSYHATITLSDNFWDLILFWYIYGSRRLGLTSTTGPSTVCIIRLMCFAIQRLLCDWFIIRTGVLAVAFEFDLTFLEKATKYFIKLLVLVYRFLLFPIPSYYLLSFGHFSLFLFFLSFRISSHQFFFAPGFSLFS